MHAIEWSKLDWISVSINFSWPNYEPKQVAFLLVRFKSANKSHLNLEIVASHSHWCLVGLWSTHTH